MNNKAFTMVELLAVVALIGILSGTAVMAVGGYINKAKQKTYENFESNMVTAAKSYLTTHTEIATIGNSTYTSDVLINEGYLEEMTDPVNKSKKCTGTVTANGVREANAFNITFTYKACITCSNYKTAGC